MAKRRNNLEGSIRERSNGTFRAYATVNGRRVSKTFKTQREAVRWNRQMQNQAEKGLDINEANVPLAEFLRNWLQAVKPSLRPRTRSQYEHHVEVKIIPYLGKIKVMDLKPFQIQNLYNKMVQEGFGFRTIEITHAVLRRALNHAEKLGIIPRNPTKATTPPKGKKKKLRILDENEAQRLLITARANYPRIYPTIHLAVSTGMRQGEILGLKFGDIKGNYLNIVRQVLKDPEVGLVLAQPKTESGTRRILISDETKEILLAQREVLAADALAAGDKWEYHDLIFPNRHGKPWDQRNLLRRYYKLLEDAALPKIRFHDLRHTAASLMLSQNVPLITVTRMLGHAKPSITLDYYGHLVPGAQEVAVEVMGQITTLTEWEESSKIAPELRQEEN